jgi:iron complex outermembrane receptor protein
MNITIRGIGSTNDTEVGDPAVSFNLDGIYLARSRSAVQMLYDLERVEVLRGPQGTLYGRNAIAGSINVVSAKPTQQLAASAALELGTYNQRRASGMLNLPVNDWLALRAAFQVNRHDGYYSNSRPAVDSPARADYDDDDTSAGRLHLLLTPTADLSLLLTADYTRIGGVGYTPAPLGTGRGADPWRFAVSSSGSDDTRNRGVAATLDWKLGANTLTYLGSVRRDDAHTLNGIVDAPANSIAPPCVAAGGEPGGTSGCNHYVYFSKQHSSSHELRLAGSAQALQWVAGLYTFSERNDAYLGIFPQATLAYIQPIVRADSDAAYAQLRYALDSTTRLTGGLRHTRDHKSRTGGTYLFGQQSGESYVCPFGGGLNAPAFTPLGLPAFLVNPATAGCLLNPNAADFRWQRTDWKLGLEHEAAPHSLLYASIGTGYKAGGFGDGAPPNNNDYGPERLLAIEIGARNRFNDERVQANLSAFHYAYRDFQVSGVGVVNGQPSTTTLNAQRAEVYGLESENIFLLATHDELTLDVAWLHARYSEFRLLGDVYHPLTAAGTACALPGDAYPYCADYSGMTLAKSPALTVSVALRHQWVLRSGGRLELQARTHFETHQNVDYHGFSATEQDAWTQSDLRLRFDAAHQRWNVTAYVRNIGNRAVVQTGSPYTIAAAIQTAGKSFGTGAYAPPRTAGVILAASF